MALEGTGRYSTVETANGLDALTELSSNRPFDCAVIDSAMPDMTGLELVRHIRKTTSPRTLPVILVLPEECSPEELHATYPGVNEVIAKPFDPWDLARRIDLLLGGVSAGSPLSIEAVLRGFPYPTMILDTAHRVILANGTFYSATNTGVGACYLHCNQHVHGDGSVPEECPLEECMTTGRPVERSIQTLFGRMRVSVYPLEARLGQSNRLFLHLTQAIDS